MNQIIVSKHIDIELYFRWCCIILQYLAIKSTVLCTERFRKPEKFVSHVDSWSCALSKLLLRQRYITYPFVLFWLHVNNDWYFISRKKYYMYKQLIVESKCIVSWHNTFSVAYIKACVVVGTRRSSCKRGPAKETRLTSKNVILFIFFFFVG